MTKNEKILVPQCLSNLVPLKSGFTLAEVLITLGIIGIVAAMTIPTLVANYQQKSMDTAANTFNRKLGEALRVMNVQATLAGHNTTQEFVNELGKHIKIVKTCSSDKLKNCFTPEFSTNEDTYKTEELTEAKNLNKDGNYGTETIGVQFADGVTALIAYNKNAKQDPYNNSPSRDAIVGITSSGEGKDRSIGLSTDALAILYDVTGSSNPNKYGTDEGSSKWKDIRGLNVSIKVGADILDLGNNGTAVNCADSTSVGYEYCTTDDKANAASIVGNYWAGAKYDCTQKGMRIPTIEELKELYQSGKIDGTSYWSSSEAEGTAAYVVYSWNGNATSDIEFKGYNGVYRLCIGN